MIYEEALSKVQKLLRLCQSSNPNEAALAASRAQEIMLRYSIEQADIQLERVDKQPEEPILNWSDDPLEQGKRMATWKGRLSLAVAKLNGCKVYHSGDNLILIGRPSNVQTVRYIYSWLCSEVDRFARRDARGYGRNWASKYRNGVVETIVARLKADREETKTKLRTEVSANPLALVRLNNALAKVEQETATVEDWTRNNIRLVNRSAPQVNYNSKARELGRAAGHYVRITKATGART